jgi:orotidine-5'-phosphate decarboxylase
MTHSKIIAALDFDHIEDARSFIDKISPDLCRLKVGKQMFTQYGPAFVEELQNKGFEIFLDLKFHDIPSTVAKACVSAAKFGVWMCNMHVSGGTNMMLAAREAIDKLNLKDAPLLIGVTVLTSMNDADLVEVGGPASVEKQVMHLAALAQAAKLDGVVCSAQEAKSLREPLGSDFLLVTPGIRIAGDAADDQQRIMTPGKALAAGADYLVIGRSITKALDPVAALTSLSTST